MKNYQGIGGKERESVLCSVETVKQEREVKKGRDEK